ncbi:receptor-type tyrosine-protein phosphatase eta-like [Symsagittifera roscoffensis]|uniref:receptor-type tyrosine-protein phosphatase eta-like n=1 Tax=Symsagittifera roscoffensis TaxID=84072 RepID=UPI00307B376A
MEQAEFTYIATQGPLHNTVNAFWRMVWEYEVTLIIMLTQCIENDVLKCNQYWPEDNMQWDYGDLTVEGFNETKSVNFTRREFRLYRAHTNLNRDVSKINSKSPVKDQPKRIVEQFQYTAWPDFGCPENPEQMLKFLAKIRSYYPYATKPESPIIVHCSAGCGRTGSFIALDQINENIEKSSVVDIRGIVASLRSARPQMVQTQEQYEFIHEAAGEMIKRELVRRKILPDKDTEYETTKGRRKRKLSLLTSTNTNEASDTIYEKRKTRSDHVAYIPMDVMSTRSPPDTNDSQKDK